MNDNNFTKEGYVYILEVKDIDLPVCKIGRTLRSPHVRCTEINNNSTGDFIWQVAYYVSVDDCMKLESLVHKKLEPLRQKNREFFNITVEIAYKALLSIIKNQSEIKEISPIDISPIQAKENKPQNYRKKKKTREPFRTIDTEYTELLQTFASLLHIKGVPFGQLNKPRFGISDGNEGIQWNLSINPVTEKIRLGVNLEGKKYSNWPITDFILSEIKNPSINLLKGKIQNPDQLFLRFVRDAWQVTSRPEIVEKYIGGDEIPISKLDEQLWISILTEARGCLNDKQEFRGRNIQKITLLTPPKNGEQIRMMEVSPHLTIWTLVHISDNMTDILKNKIEQLRPVYEWLSEICG
jgi:hypothetical protein